MTGKKNKVWKRIIGNGWYNRETVEQGALLMLMRDNDIKPQTRIKKQTDSSF